jgi:hypothetical protein
VKDDARWKRVRLSAIAQIIRLSGVGTFEAEIYTPLPWSVQHPDDALIAGVTSQIATD